MPSRSRGAAITSFEGLGLDALVITNNIIIHPAINPLENPITYSNVLPPV
jgi:hypothetical protein